MLPRAFLVCLRGRARRGPYALPTLFREISCSYPLAALCSQADASLASALATQISARSAIVSRVARLIASTANDFRTQLRAAVTQAVASALSKKAASPASRVTGDRAEGASNCACTAEVATLRARVDELAKALDAERFRHAEAEAAIGRRLAKLEGLGQWETDVLYILRGRGHRAHHLAQCWHRAPNRWGNAIV